MAENPVHVVPVEAAVVGYCFLEVAPGEFEPASMAELRPGDVFRFVECHDEDQLHLLRTVVMDEAAPAEQRQAVLRGLCKRAKRYRYHEDDDQGDGRRRCAAIPVDEAAS